MESLKTESVCSNSSTESTANHDHLIKDYSVSAMKMESGESHKLKLNFGVDRLLSKCSEIKDLDDHIDKMAIINRNLVDKNVLLLNANGFNPASFNSINAINSMSLNNNLNHIHNQNLQNIQHREENGVSGSQFGLNLLQQFPGGLYGNQSQNFVLKPFPIRINQRNGQTHNAINLQNQHHQQLFNQHLRKVPFPSTSNFPYNANNIVAFQNIFRMNQGQLSPQGSNAINAAQFNIYNQKNAKLGRSEAEASLLPKITNIGSNGNGGNVKRKRSWSRAVFSNLQRKGLERQFEVQKYITKPDRKKLAARLGLKDAQVKVWFQNRRMKWRHTNRNQSGTGAAQTKPNGLIKEENTVEEFTSSSDEEGEDMEIDVVTDK